MAQAARRESDMKHNSSPLITCEGGCKRPTTHNLLSEYFNHEKDQYEQQYACSCCGASRQFGATVCRVTAKGENN
jgi:hypothetical protein